jgi:alpha-L-arabinofuranosidase
MRIKPKTRDRSFKPVSLSPDAMRRRCLPPKASVISPRTLLALAGACLVVFGWANAVAAATKSKIMILGGRGHDWRGFCEVMAPVLEKTGAFEIVVSEKLDDLKSASLARYDAVLFYGSGGEFTDPAQEQGLADFAKNGGGVAGVHATDAFKKSDVYWRLLGGRFTTHGGGRFMLRIMDKTHVVTSGLQDFEIQDESYQTEYHPAFELHSLLRIDRGQEQQSMAWIQEHGKGRVFNTTLGHDRAAFTNEHFQRLLVRGLYWVTGRPVKDPPLAGAESGLCNVALTQAGTEIEASDSLGADVPETLIDGTVDHRLEHRWHSDLNKPHPHRLQLRFAKPLPLRRVLFHASAVHCFPTHVVIECRGAGGQVQPLADARLKPGQTVGVDLFPVTSDNLTIRLLESNSDTPGYVQLNALEVLAALSREEAQKITANPSTEAWQPFVVPEAITEVWPSDTGRQPVTIHADRPGVEVSSMLYGIFFEELSRAGDGGLYAELVRNRDFESVQMPLRARIEDSCLVTPWFRFERNDELYPRGKGSDLPWWSVLAGTGARVDIALEDRQPLNTNNPHSMRVQVQEVGARAGVANAGYWGIAVRSGELYDLSFYARSAQAYPGKVTASLESTNGDAVYAQAAVSRIRDGWKRYHAVLRSKGTDPRARLALSFSQPGTIWLDMVSLFPRHTFKNRPNGMRADIAGMLAALHPGFMRFPGGGYANGISTVDRFQWDKTIGELPQRPGNWNRWGYHVTTGMGYHEFLQFCEGIGAEPLFVMWPGVSAGAGDFAVGEQALQPYIEEMLGAVEYANGSPGSPWGAERVKNGHRRPFKLKYVEIGNEDGGAAYVENFKIMSAALKAKHPEVKTISTCPVGDAVADILDDHWYGVLGRHFAVSHIYDGRERRGPKLFIGEYAGNPDGIQASVAEAADMVGFERNGDVVTMASYAPLLVNVNRQDWGPNLIYFDTARCYGRSSYYLQRMFSLNRPDFTVETQVAAGEAPLLPAGKFGVGVKEAAAEFKGLRVTKGDQELYAWNGISKASATGTGSGLWMSKADSLRQANPQSQSCRLFGDPGWSDYVLRVNARVTQGKGGLFLAVRSDPTGEGFQLRWHLGNGTSLLEDYGVHMLGLDSKPLAVEAGRWYELRMELTGSQVKCYLDGKLMHSAAVDQVRTARFFATSGWDEKHRELVLKLVNALNTPQTASLNIRGMRKLGSAAELTTLSAAGPTEENTFEQPTKIVPVTSILSNFGHSYELPMRPWSIAVLRVAGERENR